MNLDRIFQKVVAVLGLGLASQAMPANDFSLADSEWAFSGPLSKEADEFLTDSNIEFNKKQKLIYEKYIQPSKRYDIETESGKLVFSYENHKIIFGTKFIGSFRAGDNSWEWGWNNPNFSKSLVVSEAEIKNIGKKYNLRYLLKGAVEVPNKEFPSYLSGITLKITDGALGVYCAEGNGINYCFLLFNPIEQQT
ncbi:DUF6882 domain-containing protein [Shewanella mangrovisoli]|uniref:DUF6882 domain-containing protein n=1 Tax=Shewanella mangrovisoli TaxID=2864211 RepID=UPI0035BA57F1